MTCYIWEEGPFGEVARRCMDTSLTGWRRSMNGETVLSVSQDRWVGLDPLLFMYDKNYWPGISARVSHDCNESQSIDTLDNMYTYWMKGYTLMENVLTREKLAPLWFWNCRRGTNWTISRLILTPLWLTRGVSSASRISYGNHIRAEFWLCDKAGESLRERERERQRERERENLPCL